MSTIHQHKMNSTFVDLSAVQAAQVASILRENECPYLISEDCRPEDAALPFRHHIIFMQGWGVVVGGALNRVLDPDPNPPAPVVALAVPAPTAKAA